MRKCILKEKKLAPVERKILQSHAHRERSPSSRRSGNRRTKNTSARWNANSSEKRSSGSVRRGGEGQKMSRREATIYIMCVCLFIRVSILVFSRTSGLSSWLWYTLSLICRRIGFFKTVSGFNRLFFCMCVIVVVVVLVRVVYIRRRCSSLSLTASRSHTVKKRMKKRWIIALHTPPFSPD